MNLIVICLDSLRQDHVSFYHRGRPAFEGVTACRTPNIDALAARSVVFTNAYPSALPTIPARYELMTGQEGLPDRGWEPLREGDRTVADLLRPMGYVSGLISDNYHYFEPRDRGAMNYHYGFDSYDWVRGQEYDRYSAHPPSRDIRDYANAHYTPSWRKLLARFLANTDHVETESDCFPMQVTNRAVDWLTRNRGQQRVFCWIDCFDPHEPWDPPARFDRYTDPAYRGARLILPMGGPAADWAGPDEVRHVRGLYAGECAFVDHAVGVLLDRLEGLGYLDDSILVLLADHGHPLADHGKFLKSGDRLYSEMLKVPFMIYSPTLEAGRTSALVQFADLLPTLLELLGRADLAGPMSGRSFAPVLRREMDHHRDAVISGYYNAADRCVRDGRWSYVRRPDGSSDELYDLDRDPREMKNLIDEQPRISHQLCNSFGDHWFPSSKPEITVTSTSSKSATD
mgnify:CR=1 FL=1